MGLEGKGGRKLARLPEPIYVGPPCRDCGCVSWVVVNNSEACFACGKTHYRDDARATAQAQEDNHAKDE